MWNGWPHEEKFCLEKKSHVKKRRLSSIHCTSFSFRHSAAVNIKWFISMPCDHILEFCCWWQRLSYQHDIVPEFHNPGGSKLLLALKMCTPDSFSTDNDGWNVKQTTNSFISEKRVHILYVAHRLVLGTRIQLKCNVLPSGT